MDLELSKVLLAVADTVVAGAMQALDDSWPKTRTTWLQ